MKLLLNIYNKLTRFLYHLSSAVAIGFNVVKCYFSINQCILKAARIKQSNGDVIAHFSAV